MTVGIITSPVTVENTESSQFLKEIDCLATNIYFEARNQGVAGQVAVGAVTLNRVWDRRFPNTICEVVYQAELSRWYLEVKGREVPLRNRCQFSWYCDGKPDVIENEVVYQNIFRLAELMVNSNSIIDITEGATHYHADYVAPSWAKSKIKTTEIEDHIFYRWEK